MGLAVLVLSGCASPGLPHAPTLNLPEPVTDLSAERVGDGVKLRWTTPARNTDKLALAGAVTAEICREVMPPAAAAAPSPVQASGQRCLPVLASLAVAPGASETTDRLPGQLVAGPARLLAYRVQLRNAAGRTAGASAAGFAIAGSAPLPVAALRIHREKTGAVLEWQAESGPTEPGATESVELERSLVPGALPVTAPGLPGPAARGKAPTLVKLRVSASGGDPGGAIDHTALGGESYRYVAQRVRTVVLGGRSLEVRSTPSAIVPLAIADVFPPDPPTDLVASPGFAGGAGGGEQQRAAIDLSWEPSSEAGIAGYRVYRRGTEGGAEQRLNSELVTVPAYRDLTVEGGKRYGYRVTAVDGAGNESKPGDEVVEAAPER